MRFFALFLGLICCFDAFAAMSSGRASKIVQSKPVIPQTARTNTNSSAPVYNQADNTSVAVTTTNTQPAQTDPEIAKKEKQRDICTANNIGISNTFVWAARNSDTTSYNYMIEDSSDIKNNTCFVKVQMASVDNRIDVSDIPAKYFEMGEHITCGSWVDEKDLQKRILDAKKAGRVWGTVAATVGGAAVGVGAMELFGNKLIGGKVEGQKSLSPKELLRSQILALKKSNPAEYDRIIKALNELETVCNDNTLWDGSTKPADCDAANNNFIGLRDTL